jgi:hypothetical protein
MSDTVDDKVGYKRSPKHAQFKRGQSGNRSGRPKGRRNLKLDLANEFSKTVSNKKDGRSRRVPKQRAFVETLVNGAIAGNPQLARLLISLCGQASHGELDDEPAPKATGFGYTEAEIQAAIAAEPVVEYETEPTEADLEEARAMYAELNRRATIAAKNDKRPMAEIMREFNALRKLPRRW